MSLDSKVPQGSIDKKWSQYKSEMRLVNPANKRSIDIIVIGTGLAGYFYYYVLRAGLIVWPDSWNVFL